MNEFSISDIECLSGIKAHTLRIWEQRYSIMNPRRKPSSHRSYDSEDLKSILRIVYLYERGYKISRIAALAEDEIKSLALDFHPDANQFDIYINQLTEASLDFNQDNFEKILNNLIVHAGLEKSVIQVIFPLLKKIGLLWMVDSVSPAQEHFASALIIKKMIMGIDGLERVPYKPGQRRVLLFTPGKDHHEIPLLMMHYLLKANGVATLYVGKDCSLQTVDEYLHFNQVTEMYFSLITGFFEHGADAYLKELAARWPSIRIYFTPSSSFQTSSALPDTVVALRDPESLRGYYQRA